MEDDLYDQFDSNEEDMMYFQVVNPQEAERVWKSQGSLGIDIVDNYNDTPLSLACRDRNHPLIKWFVEHGVNPRDNSQTEVRIPLATSVAEGDVDAIRFLRDNGFDIFLDLIVPIAIRKGINNYDGLNYLLQEGVNIDQTDIEDNTVLIIAIEEDDEQLVKWLLDKGFDVNTRNRDGSTALEMAIYNENIGIIADLMERGVKMTEMERNAARRLLGEDFYNQLLSYSLNQMANDFERF